MFQLWRERPVVAGQHCTRWGVFLARRQSPAPNARSSLRISYVARPTSAPVWAQARAQAHTHRTGFRLGYWVGPVGGNAVPIDGLQIEAHRSPELSRKVVNLSAVLAEQSLAQIRSQPWPKPRTHLRPRKSGPNPIGSPKLVNPGRRATYRRHSQNGNPSPRPAGPPQLAAGSQLGFPGSSSGLVVRSVFVLGVAPSEAA